VVFHEFDIFFDDILRVSTTIYFSN